MCVIISLKIAVCDDCEDDLNKICAVLEALSISMGVDLNIDTYSCAEDLRRTLISKVKFYDLLFLDILLEEDNGIELARMCRSADKQSEIVFVTISPDFAIESFDVNPLHYLLKPVNCEKLRPIIEKTLERGRKIPRLKFTNTNNVTYIVRESEIIYIEVYYRKIKVFCNENEITIRGSLSYIESLLTPEHFIRCHKSFIVNISKITSYTHTRVMLDNHIEVPMGRMYYSRLQESLIDYAEGIIMGFD